MPELKTYLASLPDAATLDAAHTLTVQQGGDLFQVTVAALRGGGAIGVDATPGNQLVDISNLSDVTITKLDSTANNVSIYDSGGYTVEGLPKYREGLSGQYETVRLVKVQNGASYVWVKSA